MCPSVHRLEICADLRVAKIGLIYRTKALYWLPRADNCMTAGDYQNKHNIRLHHIHSSYLMFKICNDSWKK